MYEHIQSILKLKLGFIETDMSYEASFIHNVTVYKHHEIYVCDGDQQGNKLSDEYLRFFSTEGQVIVTVNFLQSASKDEIFNLFITPLIPKSVFLYVDNLGNLKEH